MILSSNYKNRKVLITGGAGFIGINLANELNRLGAKVTVIDKNDKPFVNLHKNISKQKANITKIKELRLINNKYDYVFHLAARTDINSNDVSDYFENYEGTEKLLKWLDKKNLKRFVFYSTQLVVGLFNETRFIDENEPYKTKTAYGESKILGEKVVNKYCKQNKISYVIIRPTSVYGPYGKEPYRDFFLTIKNKRYFNIGKANNLVSLCYVKNLINLTLLLGLNGQADSHIFFGNDFHPYTMKEISDCVSNYFGYNLMSVPDLIAYFAAYFLGIFKLIGIKVPLYPFRLKNIKANYCYDIKNSVQLGYLPKYDLEDGLKETLDWYVKNDKDFRK